MATMDRQISSAEEINRRSHTTQLSPFKSLTHVAESQANAFKRDNDTSMAAVLDVKTESRQHSSEVGYDSYDNHLKETQNSDDSFSAYIEHPVRESTPPATQRRNKSPEEQSVPRESKTRRASMQSDSSMELDALEEDSEEIFWPSANDREHGNGIEDEGNVNLSQESTMQDEDEDDADGDMDGSGEKKRRRRTNKAEASVLASVFAQTQFPDAHAREALAQRLNMKAKAVSIWFQNRRQAMKKRASRFGGVEGVNGPTVRAATRQVVHIQGPEQVENKSMKRWMSLDDIASHGEQSPIELPPLEGNNLHKGHQVVEHKLTTAPILDFICRNKGENQLSRMASMPSLASLLVAKEDQTRTHCTKKDLRDLLPQEALSSRQELHHNISTSIPFVHGQEVRPPSEETKARLQIRERCYSLQMDSHGRARLQGLTEPTTEQRKDPPSPVVGKLSFPSLFVGSLQKQNLLGRFQSQRIWQRMESSSGSSDGCLGSSPDSNKENRDPKEAMHGTLAEDEEDEERTLRKIAGRRAAREQAKRKEKLSKEGEKYVQEADARLALQQRRRPLGPIEQHIEKASTIQGHNRAVNRTVSDAQILQKYRKPITRVPSLDMTAGRDRSKDDELPSYKSLFEARMAKRSYQNSTLLQDENKLPKSIRSKTSMQSSKRSRYSALQQSTRPSQANMQRRSNHTLLRPFFPSQSLPTSTASSLLSSRLSNAFPPFFPVSARFESSRESRARLDGATQGQSQPDSQESSENGSDDWLEAWTQEKRGPLSIVQDSRSNSIVLRDRSILLNAESSKSKQLLARHDDSGFYSDSAEEEGGVPNAGKGNFTAKGRLVKQASSSPSKRGGDERDRLAAETLLGLGVGS